MLINTELPKQRSEEVATQFAIAVNALKTGRNDEFAMALRRVLEIDAKHLPALQLLADLNLAQGNLAAAADISFRILQQDKNNVEATLVLGLCFFNQSNKDMARKSFERVLKLNPNHAVALDNLQPLLLAETSGGSLPSGSTLLVHVPEYSACSAGVRVMHYMAALLRAADIPVAVTHPCFFNPTIPIRRQALSDDIVIYPDATRGNPVGAKRICRYMLYYPSAYYGGDRIAREECTIVYHRHYLAEVRAHCDYPLTEDDIITLPILDREWCFPEAKTIENVLYVGKGKDKALPNIEYLPIAAANAPQDHRTPYTPDGAHRKTLAVLRKAKNFYTLDENTLMSCEAALCGCKVFFVKDAQTFEEQTDILEAAQAHVMSPARDVPLGRKIAEKIYQFFEKGSVAHEAKRLEPPLSGEPSRCLDTIPGRAMTPRAAPAVSVIIPVLNKIELTRKCLEALRQNTPAELCEVIVWDNGSSDGTRVFFEQPSAANSGARYFRSEENLGFVGGNNAAVQQARGRYLVFLNNDTEPQAGWLEALLQTIEADPSIGAVGAKLIYPNGQLQEAGGIIFRDASGWNYGRREDPRDPRFNFAREVDYCSAACLLVRAELFRQLGGFDSRYAPVYYEDTDLCFALRQGGHKVVYQPRCAIIHHEGATAGQDLNKGFKQHQVINRQKFFEKWEKTLAQQSAPDAALARRASHRVGGQRILVIDPLLPMYDRASGSKRMFEMLKLLVAGGHAVTFIARNGHGAERYAKELEQVGVEVYAGDAERMKECGYTVNCWPLDLKKLLIDTQYDMVILSFWHLAQQYLSRIREWSPKSRVVIDTVDVHFLRERRQAELYRDEKLLQQANETYRQEVSIYRQADALITVTTDDRQTLQRELPESRIFVVSNIHELAKEVAPAHNRDGLLFVGNFAHPPNQDAVLYFHHEIWPRILSRVPGARWTIAGNNPPAAVQALAGAAIEVTGYVPSLEPYLSSHLISVAPLRYGAGMKGKIGEALAHGLPVVTTTIGAEGMSLQSGDGGVLVADDPETFAAHVARLYAERELWNQLSAQGRRHVESHFTPHCIGRQLETLLDWSASFTSIIVLAHNQWEDTEQCLQSIARHTPEPYEIILVDNGSTDKTRERARALAVKDSRVRVITNRDNRGFAAGNNQGLAIARGRYVVLLNNDTVVTGGWLERMLAVFKGHPETGLAGPMSNNVSGPQIIAPAPYENLAEMPAFAEKWAAAHAGESLEAPRLVGFCLLMRREVVETIGALDPRFGRGNFEDDDFCIRAGLAGFKLRVALDSFVHHTGGQTFKGAKIDYRASLSENWELFKAKWGLPSDAPLEKGYRLPPAAPAGVALHLPLPDLSRSHVFSLEGRTWTDKMTPEAARKKTARKPAVLALPACALAGHLGQARNFQKQWAAAWRATADAIGARPHHPEAYLLLAEIALAAGDGETARLCARRACDLAPGWAPPKQFLKRTLRGKAKPEWLELPPALVQAAPPRLTVCLIAKNEEKFLGQCLSSVKGLAAQIVVVDTGSTDRTMEIAREHGAEVHHFDWCDDFSAARNAALEHARGDWVLVLDADEELMPGQAEALAREMQAPQVMGYRLPIIDIGREQEGCSYVPRLFRNAPGLFFVGRVHEQAFSSIQVRCQQWGLKHQLGKARLLHHGYTCEVVASRKKAERNLRLLERAVEELPEEPNLLMSLGLELARSGQLEAGIDRYWEAFHLLSGLPGEQVTPELRETLLTQLSTQLLAAKRHSEVVKLWQIPFAKAGGLTASQHFTLGLAHLELKQPAEAAEQMRQCLAKRGRPALSPINAEIVRAGPNHCLALCLTALKQSEAAGQAFEAALADDPTSRPARFDFAQFQATQGRPIEALKLLHQLASENPAEARVWQFGGQIALSRPQYLEFARTWTGEAVKNFPQDPAILLQRAEALLLSQEAGQALPLWRQAHAPNCARHRAAIVLCELLTGDRQHHFLPAEEPAISQEAARWYRQWISVGAHALINQLNERMEQARLALPGFARAWEAAHQQARRAAA